MFSESLLGKVRKRLRVFDKDPVTGTTTFKAAYLKVLQATAKPMASANPDQLVISAARNMPKPKRIEIVNLIVLGTSLRKYVTFAPSLKASVATFPRSPRWPNQTHMVALALVGTRHDGKKRPNKTTTRSDLLDYGWDWDDETVLTILKQLEAACHAEYLVVDGMSDDNVNTRKQLSGAAGMRGSLLVPLKLATGQRLLVVVELNRLGKSERGVLRYYDPCGPPDEDAVTEYAPVMKLVPLLSRVLPDRDLDPALWKSEYCVCPELSCEQDSGLSICLQAMYAVGDRPLPETVDWIFWRHLILRAFFPDDTALQLRISHYRQETVQRLILKGQMSNGALVPQGRRVSSDIEYLGTAAMNPVDRIECRADNAKKTIEVVHEGCRIFHNLQEQVDMGKADLKTRLDKSTHIRDSLRRKLNIGDQIVLGVPRTKTEHDDETVEAFDRLTLQQAIEEIGFCTARLDGISASSELVRKALQELAFWRRDVNAAVLEDDASISGKQAT
ncbi:hypothetical protein UCDDA912_g02857 [Diaporthe ampelina]|uniref:Uncharacterized protein n=1 Tax=Diaporthe ampelina TaxID=1214573 RepID=A0A0G2FTD3_9PEZI|nr:hypothetical protein UCDDA912_g02857 [Diaporthe ampelina]